MGLFLALGRAAYHTRGEQQNDGTDCGRDDSRDHATTESDTEHRKQITGNDGPKDSDDDIANKTVPRALHYLTSKPARDRADNQPNQNRFGCEHHLFSPYIADRITCDKMDDAGVMLFCKPVLGVLPLRAKAEPLNW